MKRGAIEANSMKRRIAIASLAAIVAVILVAPRDGESHNVPARRTVTVQANATSASILVTWTSARSSQGATLLARAAWGRSGDATARLRGLASSEALKGLVIEHAGKPARIRDVKVKVRVDTGNATDPTRVVCVVLLTVDLSAGDLVVSNRNGAKTAMRWLDRSDGAASSKVGPRLWLAGRRTVRVRFQ